VNNLDTNNTHYTTSDTAQATYLIVEGYILSAIDYSQPRYIFSFQNNADTIQEFATKYITGKALVDPAAYTRVNRKLLRLLKNQMQWGDE